MSKTVKACYRRAEFQDGQGCHVADVAAQQPPIHRRGSEHVEERINLGSFEKLQVGAAATKGSAPALLETPSSEENFGDIVETAVSEKLKSKT